MRDGSIPISLDCPPDPPAPWGGFEPPTWRLHRTPRFPAGVDYLFAIALQALGAGRIVSEPSRTSVRAWLRIAVATTRRRFPAIHPVTPLSFPKELPLTTEPLALPLSYQGVNAPAILGYREVREQRAMWSIGRADSLCARIR